MSLLEDLHAERKARLVRLGAGPKTSVDSPSKVQAEKIAVLTEALERKTEIIKGLEDVIARQRMMIRQFADESEVPTPRMNDIIITVAEFHNISKAMLIGNERTKLLVLARQIVYYLGRKNGYSLHQVGRACDKDHTTALYGANKIAGLVTTNYLDLATRISEIENRLHEFVCTRVEQTTAALP